MASARDSSMGARDFVFKKILKKLMSGHHFSHSGRKRNAPGEEALVTLVGPVADQNSFIYSIATMQKDASP